MNTELNDGAPVGAELCVAAASGPGPQGAGQWWRQDLGMATAEYAIATLAACGFAGLLLVILRSEEVRSALSGIITRALTLA